MVPEIVYVRVGYSNSILLLNGSSSILVDVGVAGNLKTLMALFRRQNIQPKDIKLIILTHTHYDHTGNLTELVKLTSANVLVHKNEFQNLKDGFTPIPRGVGFYPKIISKMGRTFLPKFASPPPFEAQLINEDEFDLKAFGIDGKVISTPGHTLGSQSVLIGNQLIAGDTFMNRRGDIIFPYFVNDPVTLLHTWKMLFDLGVEKIYPAHGKQLTREKAIAEYKKWRIKFKM